MGIELATAFVSLTVSARGIAASIADELGKPLDREAGRIGTKTGDRIGSKIRSAVAGIDLPAIDLPAVAAPLIGQPEIPAPAPLNIGGIPAPKIGRPEIPEPGPLKVRSIPAPTIGRPKIPEPVALKVSSIPAPLIGRPQIPEPDAVDLPAIPAPKIGQPEIPRPAPLGLDGIPAPKIGRPQIPEPDPLSVDDMPAPKIGQPEIPEADDEAFLSGAKKAGLAAGAAASAGLAVGFISASGAELSNDRLAAQLGIDDPAFAEDLGKTAGRVYKDAFGDSIGEVNAAIRAVFQNGLVDEDATNAQIESVSEKVLGLADVFEQDLGGTAAAVGQLIKTGMAKDATEGLDLITRGFQQGADKRGDFLDTIIEYGTQFRKLGIDGPKAIGLLSQGLRGGARDADVVADAIKEFSIRAIDGTKATAAGFRQVGLDATAMANAVGAGGPRAAAALDTVLDRLRAMPDPVQRAQAAVALFGTQAEDLGDALFGLDPSAAVEGLGEIAGAADRMNAVVGDNSATAFESFKRKAETALAGVAGGFAPVIGGALDLAPALGGLVLVAPHIASLGVKLGDLAKSALGIGKTTQAVGELATATKGLAGASAALEASSFGGGAILAGAKLAGSTAIIAGVALAISRAADSAVPALEKIDRSVIGLEEKIPIIGGFLGKIDRAVLGLGKSSEKAEGPLLKAAAAIAGIEAEKAVNPLLMMARAVDTVSGSLDTVSGIAADTRLAQNLGRDIDSLGSSTTDLNTVLGRTVTGLGEESAAFDDTTGSVEDYDDAMNRLIGVHVSAERAAIDLAASHHDLAASVQENGRSLDLATVGGRANREAILGIITATTDHINAMREEGATTDQLNATFGTHRSELAAVLKQLGFNKDESARYLGLLDAVPDNVLTTVKADTAQATKAIKEFVAGVQQDISFIASLGSRGPLPKFHTGGIVPGPRGSEMVAVLEAGERVIPAAQIPVDGGGPGGLNVGDINVTTDREARIGRDVRFELQNLVYLIGA